MKSGFIASSLFVLFFTALQSRAYGADREPGGQSLTYLAPEEEIDLALGAAPEHLRHNAAVYVFGVNGYALARLGSNGVTCLVNRDGQQTGSTVLRPTCWDREGSATIVPVVLRVGELLARGMTAADIARDIDTSFNQGHFVSPQKTGIAYMLRGDIRYDPATKRITSLFPPHYMVYAPGVNNVDIGLTADAQKMHPSLPAVYSGYAGGTRTAYLIILATADKLAGRSE